MSSTPWSLTPQCQWHKRVWLSGVNDTKEFDSVVSMIQKSLTQWCQWHCEYFFSFVNISSKLNNRHRWVIIKKIKGKTSCDTDSLSHCLSYWYFLFKHGISVLPAYFILWYILFTVFELCTVLYCKHFDVVWLRFILQNPVPLQNCY